MSVNMNHIIAIFDPYAAGSVSMRFQANVVPNKANTNC